MNYIVTWGTEQDRKKAINQYGEALEGAALVNRSEGSVYKNIESNISVRDEFTRSDYEYFRFSESVPTDIKQVIKLCNKAYHRVGIIRNTIDTMSEFAVKGVDIVHPEKRKEKLCKAWAETIDLKNRSERFLNLLYRTANVVVQRFNYKDLEEFVAAMGDNLLPSVAAKINPSLPIPSQYSFLTPEVVDVEDEEYAALTGDYSFVIDISNTKIKKRLSSITNNLPSKIRRAIKRGDNFIKLDKENTLAFFYKKDDGKVWAIPMIYAILDDVVQLEKTKLADMSALDGVINQVRIWKLGDLDKKILPNKAAFDRLNELLTSHPGNGAPFDLIWGPELTFEDHTSTSFRFLGDEKYKPILRSIYDGLGVRFTGNFTSNAILFKTIIERLEYGRTILTKFWEGEFERLRKAMGWRTAPSLKFNMVILSDEVSMMRLLIDLLDRNALPYDTIVELFGRIPQIEKAKLKKEMKEIESRKRPRKAGPWHDPEHIEALEKIALQNLLVTPEDVGIESSLTPEQVDNINDPNPENTSVDNNKKGEPGQGRPKNSKDKFKRKRKRVVPRTSMLIKLRELKHRVSQLIDTIYASKFKGVKLSQSQLEDLRNIKFSVFFSIENFNIGTNDIVKMLQKPLDMKAIAYRNKIIKESINDLGRSLTLSELDDIEIMIKMEQLYGENND